LRKKNYYSEEVKWKVIEMKNKGYRNKEIMDLLGIKNVTQIKTWMKWFKEEESHRFSQGVGKQYSYGKGIYEGSVESQKDKRIRQLEMEIEVLKKYQELQGR
jgi:transposase